MSSPKVQIVEDLIKSDKVVIFSKTYCPYCRMAKEVFDTVKQKFTVIELDEREDCDEIQNILGEMTGARSKLIKLANPKGVIKSENGKVIRTPKELDQKIEFQTAVPRVFVKGECLGGGSDVKALLQKGELQKYLD